MPNNPCKLGFIGLGQMGQPMATNLTQAGHEVSVYDVAELSEKNPVGATACGAVAEVATRAETVFLSLPDHHVSLAVAQELATASDRIVQTVVETSTVGVEGALEIGQRLADSGIALVDAPVSGGRAGAVAGTLTVMFSGTATQLEALSPILEAIAKNVFHVGEQWGQGQAMKLLNNFLSGVAMLATSEAIAFGKNRGLDPETMCQVLNVSTGINSATRDKFPKQIIPGHYAAGFTNTLLTKDLCLYLAEVQQQHTPDRLGAVVTEFWQRFTQAEPNTDFTRVFPYLMKSRNAE